MSDAQGVEEQAAMTVQELAEEVREAKSAANDARKLAEQAQDKLLDVREREMKKDQRITELENELESAQSEIESLRERTGLLQTAKNASSMKIDQRAAVLIQTLYNKAWSKKQSNAKNTDAKAAVDYKAAEAALGGSVARATILRTFDKAQELVGDESVVRKVKEDKSSSKNTRLVLNLEAGDVPAEIAGQDITQPEGN